MDPTAPLHDPTRLLADVRSDGAPDLRNVRSAEEARQVAEDFEAFFLAQMLSHMFADIETDPIFGGGPGEDVFKSMLVDEYGKVMARSGGVGIAESLQREILKLQEVE